MKLIYIYHSGYALETEDFIIIFDYYQDSEGGNKGVVHEQLLKSDKKIYVLASHSHPDHFNPEILKWEQVNPSIKYIFSKDILDEKKAKESDAIYLDKLGIYSDDLIYVKAFGSTDIGVSFLLEINDKTIFHAGDLNNWHWNEEANEEYVAEAEAYYERELKLLADNVRHIDIAMFPIDPRLGKDYMKGADQFVSAIKVDILAPMHFDLEYDKIAAFEKFAVSKNCKYICWKHKGEYINL